MTKEKLEKLLDEFARCLHLRGKYRCQRCRYANTNLQRLGECESMLKNDVYVSFKNALLKWEPKEEEE